MLRTGYHYTYSDIEIKELIRLGKAYSEAYVMFNNMNMYDDAKRLKALLEAVV
jgi:uncharacterized protein YecE (DUF72 family)